MNAPFQYRFLFDECLSPDLVGVANSAGFDASHVNYFGRRGTSDRLLARLAVARDTVFATNNARDFKRIYADIDLHPGLNVILPSVRPDEQGRLLTLILTAIRGLPDCLNKLMEIDRDGVITISDLSRDA